ncbi:MAG: hypothetical protein NC122_07720 [Faecalibacterium sp.]|nr:hypothetical protein [Ruminococcus sp.]MCM1392781.1 hypothetical protein [Ruminococcus sp.]MCM1486081.1 hypothetical protein [Faecalibacterium sp.]
MKKALSVFLAILMIFASLSVGVSAEGITNPEGKTEYHQWGAATEDQCVMRFYLNSGTMKYAMPVYNLESGSTKWSYEENISGTWDKVPMRADEMRDGDIITFPTVVPPANQQFDGWYCREDGITYGANGIYVIPEGSAGKMLSFVAMYSVAVVEDTSSNIFGILSKVFGTILGLLMFSGNVDEGVAFVEKMLGGIFS